MEITILYSIMHVELRPWLIDTSNKKRFTELVKPAFAGSPDTYAELQTQLKHLLSDFSALQKNLAEGSPTAKAVVRPAFYEIELPKPNDVFRQFYSYLITRETLRVSNLLWQQAAKLTEEIDIFYIVKQALKSIKALTKKTADELRERGYTSFPDANSEFTHFVLFTLKQMLSALFFEVQERYRNVLKEFETEETFYLTVLNENHSGSPLLQPTPSFFEFKIQNLISENKFSEPTAVDLLKQIQQLQNAKLQTLQAALENLVFLHSQNTEIANTALDQLTTPDFITQHFSLAKKSITQEINQYNYGHERLDVVNTTMNGLDYIQATPVNKFSVPQKIYLWLQENKIVYTTTASQFYSVDVDGESELKKGSKPLPKKGLTTPEMHKQTAAEHLKFMSGANVHNEKIMPDEAYQRMMNYVGQLIDTGKVPTDVKQISQINLPTFHIRYTFYLLHKTLYGTKRIKQPWITFLHKVFSQFKDTETNTTKVKFSVKPKNYDSDIRVMQK